MVLEAMAAGLPVVITHGCNLPEVGKRKAGLVVDDQAGAIARALHEILRAPDRARDMGANGKRLVAEQFTWRRIAQRTIDAYEQARSTAASTSTARVAAPGLRSVS